MVPVVTLSTVLSTVVIAISKNEGEPMLMSAAIGVDGSVVARKLDINADEVTESLLQSTQQAEMSMSPGTCNNECHQERVCGKGRVLNSDLEIWTGRTCSHVLHMEGGWLCEPGDNPAQREKAVAFFEQWCCHDVDEQPLTSFNCTLEEVCGEDPDYHAAFQDPDYILWEGRSCSKVLNEERGWVCREKHQRLPQYQDEHDGGVEYFKKQCCKEKFPWEKEPVRCRHNHCCLAHACGNDVSVPVEHWNTPVWGDRTCHQIATSESGWVCDHRVQWQRAFWDSPGGIEIFRDTCCGSPDPAVSVGYSNYTGNQQVTVDKPWEQEPVRCRHNFCCLDHACGNDVALPQANYTKVVFENNFLGPPNRTCWDVAANESAWVCDWRVAWKRVGLDSAGGLKTFRDTCCR